MFKEAPQKENIQEDFNLKGNSPGMLVKLRHIELGERVYRVNKGYIYIGMKEWGASVEMSKV